MQYTFPKSLLRSLMLLLVVTITPALCNAAPADLTTLRCGKNKKQKQRKRARCTACTRKRKRDQKATGSIAAAPKEVPAPQRPPCGCMGKR